MTAYNPYRRQFLVTAGAATLAAGAGCLGFLQNDGEPGESDEPGDDDDTNRCEVDDTKTVLGPPAEGVPVDNPPFPTYGDPIPEVTVPAPLHDRDVTMEEFVCDRHQLYTFIFTRCHEACPGLTAVLRQVQADSIDEGYADEMAFVQITFDPEYDTPEVLAEYEAAHGVNPDPSHWYSLRPESPARAKSIVHETFGQEYAKIADEEDDSGEKNDSGFNLDDLDGAGDEIGDQSDDETGHSEDNGHGETDEMPFMHLSLVLLVNKAGYVERAYAYEVPNYLTVIEETQELIERW